MTSRRTLALALLAACAAGCQGGSDESAAEANRIAEDPFGATGAPGADMTDNGVNDGASGVADNSQAVGNGG